MSKFHAALEIGTTRTVLATGEEGANGRLRITSHAEIPSTGIRKSQILDISQASQSILTVLRDIEKNQEKSGVKMTIGNAILAVSGQHIVAEHAEGVVQVEHSKVGESDVMTARRRARQMPIANNRELLDIVDQNFTLDSMGGIIDPIGMSGRVLKLNALHIHGDTNRLADARTAAQNAHLEILESIFATTCAADAVLDERETRNGTLVIDLGGGSTGYAVYCDSTLASAGIIGVGGDHVTNDIAHAFQTTNTQAEQLKISEGSAMLGQYAPEALRIRMPTTSPLMDSRTISRRALDTVINARYKELFTVLRERLEEDDLLHRIHSGAVLTGGGAGTREIEALAEQTLGVSIRRGRPIHVDGLEDVEAPWSYAVIAGTIMYAHHNYDEKSVLGNLFGRFFK